MPIVRPEIQKVLREIGLEKAETPGSASERLSAAGLSLDRVAENLQDLASSGNEAVRLKATEMALKVHGALKEQPTSSIPTFNIIITGSSQESSVNPIVFPRQSLQIVADTKEKTDAFNNSSNSGGVN